MKTFGEFQEAAAAVKALPTIVKAFTKVAPKLQTFAKFSTAIPVGLTAAETIMQIKNPKRSVYTGTRKSQYKKKERIPTKSSDKTNEVAKDLGLDLTDPRQRRKAQSRAIARGLKKKK